MLSKQVETAVDRLKTDYVFTYQDLNLPPEKSANVIRKLNRMVAVGAITKLAKGRYYKPRQTAFGALKPSLEEVVKDLLVKDGKTIGYLTGYPVFNQMGLTTQISNIIEIGTNVRRNKTKRGNYEIRFSLQPNPILPADILFLQFLDAVRNIKSIPDSSVEQSYKRLLHIMRSFDEKALRRTCVLAQSYPPMVRALIGAMLDSLYDDGQSQPLYDSLNPVTRYKVGLAGAGSQLSKWRIL